MDTSTWLYIVLFKSSASLPLNSRGVTFFKSVQLWKMTWDWSKPNFWQQVELEVIQEFSQYIVFLATLNLQQFCKLFFLFFFFFFFFEYTHQYVLWHCVCFPKIQKHESAVWLLSTNLVKYCIHGVWECFQGIASLCLHADQCVMFWSVLHLLFKGNVVRIDYYSEHV